MPCPLCGREFTIPDDWLSGTQKNFFMDRLIRARKLSGTGRETQQIRPIPCDGCSNEASESETVKPASAYCVQCQKNYCKQCSLCHRSFYSHTQMSIGKEPDSAELISKISPSVCEQHRSEETKMFCQECKVAICTPCFVKSHKTHDCSDIEEVSDNFRNQLVSDTDKVALYVKKIDELLPYLEKDNYDVVKHLAGIEGEINTAAKLIAAVQRDRAKLLSEVESIRMKRVQQLETMKQYMTALESFKRYSEALLSSGTACDVTRSANSLHQRADELTNVDVVGLVDRFLPPVNVTFTSSTLLGGDDRNLVGTIAEEGQ